jgi:hypothetical protein
MPRDVGRNVELLFRHLDIWRYSDGDELRKTLKSMGDLAKKYGEILFPGWWKWLVNWETLEGYVPLREVEDFTDELREWVEGDILHTTLPLKGASPEGQFLDDLRSGIDQFLQQAPSIARANQTAPTIERYVTEIGYSARSGSSQVQESVSYLDRDGIWRKAKKTKWRAALALPPDRIRRVLREKRSHVLVQENKAIQKREAGKVRAVVNADDPSFWAMDYVSWWLETALAGHPWSTLFMSKRQLVTMWDELARGVEFETGVKLPLDQSHFDWQQNKRMLGVLIASIRAFIKLNADIRVRDDLLQAVWVVEQFIVVNTGKLRVGKTTLRITKGVMSGWRWTALMDTLFNWGEFHAAKELSRRWGLPTRVFSAHAQGDDDQLTVGSWGEAASIVLAYQAMNFDINPSKFFVSVRRDEFLRQVCVAGDVSGYPVRTVLGILWRNPVSRDPPSGVLRASEQASQWNLLVGRGASKRAVLHHMRSDIANANNLSRSEVDALLQTPRCFGGLGMFDPRGTNDWLELQPGRIETTAHVRIADVRSLDSELQRWVESGLPATKEWAVGELSGNLELPRARKEVIPGGVVPHTAIRQYTWEPTGGGAVPLRAHMRAELPRTLGDAALRLAIRHRMWDWIETQWMDSSLLAVSERIRSNGGRRIWIDWLEGKLPFAAPLVWGWSQLAVSDTADSINRAAWARIVGKWKFNMANVKRAAYTAEIWIRWHLSHRRVHQGG